RRHLSSLSERVLPRERQFPRPACGLPLGRPRARRGRRADRAGARNRAAGPVLRPVRARRHDRAGALAMTRETRGSPMPNRSPASMQDGWTTASPGDVGLDADRLGAAVAWLYRPAQQNLHSPLRPHRGALAFEHYRKGTDQRDSLPDGQHGVAVRHDLRSATKSVTGLLAGIALERKHLPGLDARVLDYFAEYPDLRTHEKVRITVRHLLTMSAGLDWDENVPLSEPH